MANWLYNGVVLPELPDYYIAKHPYAVIFLDVDGSTYGLLAMNKPPTPTGFTYAVGETLCGYMASCPSGGSEWANLATVERVTTEAEVYNVVPVWTNTDIRNAGGSLFLAASNPIRLDSKLSISLENMMQYNGETLPDISTVYTPELQAKYPYAVIDHFMGMTRLVVFPEDADYHYSEILDIWCFGFVDYVEGEVGLNWLLRETESGIQWADVQGTANAILNDVIWSNFDLYTDNTRNTLLLPKSDPVPCCPSAVFTCSNLNSTDSVYKIAAWCYPKGTKWSDAPFTYTSAANFPGKEHSEGWSLPALTAGTEYELYAAILVDDVATDHNALITFTTDGMAELDFSNATLTVDTGVVQHNSYTFKLAYSGLPYNADGTSAVFEVVGVTDAGDRAYMGWHATSGSDTVNGTFIDLEPLTDYTATFEVYYNGKPTGVTATASFTTEEEHVPGDMNHDSFPLGFASGLCGVPITETDAEHNSWAQGYIVGSALRKAL